MLIQNWTMKDHWKVCNAENKEGPKVDESSFNDITLFIHYTHMRPRQLILRWWKLSCITEKSKNSTILIDLQEFSLTQDEMPRSYMPVVTGNSDSNYPLALWNKNSLKTRVGQWGLFQLSCEQLTIQRGSSFPRIHLIHENFRHQRNTM